MSGEGGVRAEAGLMRTRMKIMVIPRNQFPILLIPGLVGFVLLFCAFLVGPTVTPGLAGDGILSSFLMGVVCNNLDAFNAEGSEPVGTFA